MRNEFAWIVYLMLMTVIENKNTPTIKKATRIAAADRMALQFKCKRVSGTVLALRLCPQSIFNLLCRLALFK